MAINKKVIWYEGMTLDPHHFQQWDRFHQANLNFAIRSLVPYYWGLSDISIETDALLNGQFKLVKLSGLMPDGLNFDMPDNDPLPVSRNISEHFPATQESLEVYLTIPQENPGGKNCLLDDAADGRAIRYRLENISLNDQNTGSDQRQIGVARTNFQIHFGTESMEGFTEMKIAEIVRSPQGDFALNDDYIAPCLSIKASENLLKIGRRLLELFVARSNALRNRRRQSSSGQLDVTPADLPLYWHLSSLNTYIPHLNQFISSGKYHPQLVFNSLTALAGLLTTFSTDDSILPGDLPVYDHNNLTAGFMNVEKKIRRLLGDVVPQKNYLSLGLEKQGENLSICSVKEPTVLKDFDLFLVCSGEIPEKKLINEVPMKFRVASPDMINEVLSTATRALNISFSSHPPSGLPSKPGVQYFKLEKQGPFWTAIEKSQSLVIYIPAEFKGIDLDLIAVKKVT
jgi:type VI secretion system protein ImpJ